MNIFKDGYLKKKYLNPEYRGLVGWLCKEEGEWDNGKLVAVAQNRVFVKQPNGPFPYCDFLETIQIPEFTPQQIPAGEFCWVKYFIDGVRDLWRLKVSEGITPGGCLNTADDGMFICFVPFLIAKTEEDAERLKNWHKNNDA